MLKSDQCLAALIRFYDHENEEYELGLKDVQDYLSKHKKVGVVAIKLGIEAMNQKLENLCEDLLTLTHIKDDDRTREDMKRDIRNSKMRKNASNNALTMTPNQKEKSAVKPLAQKNKPTTPVVDFESKPKRFNLN